LKDKMTKLFQYETECLKKAYHSGIKMGLGSDVDYNSFCKNPGNEFILRKKLIGMKEIDIILQATIQSAEILQCDKILGSIKEEKYADMIVVDGNPLENIELMNTGIVHVFKEGIKYK
jgi:imidazolonepropionase-like amidohydrolase